MDISIIIPGYNTLRSDWERCIVSVKNAIARAYYSAEIICVDDGSVDGARFLDERDDVVVIHQSNQGPSVARNQALSIAKGRWVSFVDSDDVLHKDVFCKTVSVGTDLNCDVVVFGVQTVWPQVRLQKEDVLSSCHMGILSPKHLRQLRDSNLLNYVWNKLYRREFLLKNCIQFPLDAVMGEDLIFNLTCAICEAKWASVDYVGYTYYRTGGTLLSRYKPCYISGLLLTEKMWQAYADFICSRGDNAIDLPKPLSLKQLNTLEWQNIWLPKTPYSLLGRWKWLREHPEVGGVKTFVKTFVYTLLRRYFYFNCVRKWHIKRLYPYAKEVK